MDQRTIDTYNSMVKEYDDETTDFWDRFPRTFLDLFVTLSGKKVLDVGSGPGRDGLLLQEAGKDVVCLDASKEMIKMSTKRGLISMLGDFTSLPFEDGSFNAVWAYTSLLHVPKDTCEIALKEIHRVLPSGGVFALGLIEGDTELYKEDSLVDKPRWFSYYEKHEVEKLLLKHGFEVIHFESFKPRTRNYLNFLARRM